MEGTRTGYIYRIYSTDQEFTEDESYYGSTWDLGNRKRKHISDAFCCRNECRSTYLINKYPLDTIKFEIVETLPNITKEDREKKEINDYILVKPCLNFLGKTGLAGRNLKGTDYKKEWYKNNIESIKIYRATKHKCECGRYYDNGHKAEHLRTSIHKRLVENKGQVVKKKIIKTKIII